MERRAGRRQQRSTNGPCSPSLLDFAPNLLSELSSSSSSAGTENVDRNQSPRSESSGSPLRSPLHKSRRGGGDGARHGRQGTRSMGNHRSPPSSSTPAWDDEEYSQSEDRQVRKRLWADEVDEAFVEGDLDDTETQPVVACPKTPTKEQLARRQKDIDYGKATQGYKNYLQSVPKDQRGRKCPQTPDKNGKVARRGWDNSVRCWRRALHEWDVPSPSLTPTSSPSTRPPLYAAGKKTPKRGKAQSPFSSTTSSPSDRGYSTTPDSKADNSSQDLDDEGYWMGPEGEIPSPKRDWEREGGETGREEYEEEHLDQRVQKLKIEGSDVYDDDKNREGLEEGERKMDDQVPV